MWHRAFWIYHPQYLLLTESIYYLEIKLLIFSEDVQVFVKEGIRNRQDQDTLFEAQTRTFHGYRFPPATPAEHRRKGYPIETPTPPEERERLMRMFKNGSTTTVSFVILLLAHWSSSRCQDEIQADDPDYQDANLDLDDFIFVSNLKRKRVNQQDDDISEHGSDFNSGINEDGEMVGMHRVTSKVTLLFLALPLYSIILDICHCSR